MVVAVAASAADDYDGGEIVVVDEADGRGAGVAVVMVDNGDVFIVMCFFKLCRPLFLYFCLLNTISI